MSNQHNCYREHAKRLHDIIWAVENDMMVEPTDMETLKFAAKELDTLADNLEDQYYDSIMQQEIDVADLSYHNDLMGIYGGDY